MILDKASECVELSSITFGEGSVDVESPRRLDKEREEIELSCSLYSSCLFFRILHIIPEIIKIRISTTAPLIEAIVGVNKRSMCVKSDNKERRDVAF